LDDLHESDKIGDYFLFLGRLVPEKGIFDFLECAKRNPDINFVAAGSGQSKEDVEKYIICNNLKNVTVTGHITGERLTGVISNCRASIIPSGCFENAPL
jgi:glycosyltransferase involved in cell wall biosynthesis